METCTNTTATTFDRTVVVVEEVVVVVGVHVVFHVVVIMTRAHPTNKAHTTRFTSPKNPFSRGHDLSFRAYRTTTTAATATGHVLRIQSAQIKRTMDGSDVRTGGAATDQPMGLRSRGGGIPVRYGSVDANAHRTRTPVHRCAQQTMYVTSGLCVCSFKNGADHIEQHKRPEQELRKRCGGGRPLPSQNTHKLTFNDTEICRTHSANAFSHA